MFQMLAGHIRAKNYLLFGQVLCLTCCSIVNVAILFFGGVLFKVAGQVVLISECTCREKRA